MATTVPQLQNHTTVPEDGTTIPFSKGSSTVLSVHLLLGSGEYGKTISTSPLWYFFGHKVHSLISTGAVPNTMTINEALCKSTHSSFARRIIRRKGKSILKLSVYGKGPVFSNTSVHKHFCS